MNIKQGIVVGAVLGLGFLAAGAAKADDEPVGPPPPPPGPDIPPIPAEPGKPDVPLPPPPPLCNFSGCKAWDATHQTPAAYALRLQQLGYALNPAAPGWSILSNASRTEVREFQRDYNAVRTEQTVQPTPPKLAEDGLVGNMTAAAIAHAHDWVIKLNLPWADLVALA